MQKTICEGVKKSPQMALMQTSGIFMIVCIKSAVRLVCTFRVWMCMQRGADFIYDYIQ